MRKLLAKDIVLFTKILMKMELKNTIKNMFNPNENNGDMTAELIWGIVENYHKAEKDFINFLAELEGKKLEEIENLELNDFISLIQELFSENNMPFFKFAAK